MTSTTHELAQLVDQEDAARVLWFYGHIADGIPAEPFTKALVTAMDRADHINTALLATAYPSLSTAVHLARNVAEGITVLRQIARAGQ